MTAWITAALNGSTVTRADTPHVPLTPAEIAADALACAAEGAAVVHLHVRDPETGRAAHDLALYRETVERIRERDPDLVLNLTGGGGGTIALSLDPPAIAAEAAAGILTAEERLAHLGPAGADMAGLDCGSFSWLRGGEVYLAPADMLVRGAGAMRAAGVLPELSVFDLGQMALALDLREAGHVPDTAPFSIGFDLLWGAPARLSALDAFLDMMPPGARWSAAAKGEAGHRLIAPLAATRGGGIRTGIEDHPHRHGAPVTNAALVAEAVRDMAAAGVTPLDAPGVRRLLGLPRP